MSEEVYRVSGNIVDVLNSAIYAGFARSDPQQDILKLVVINRYYDAPPAVAFVKNFGFKKRGTSLFCVT